MQSATAFARSDVHHLPDAHDREPMQVFLRGGAIDRLAAAQRKKARDSAPYEKTEIGLGALDEPGVPGSDPQEETRKVVRAPEPTIDVSAVKGAHRALVLACVADALRAPTELAAHIRRKVAGTTLRIVSAQDRNGYHAWDDGSPDGLEILYRVEGAPFRTETEDGRPKDNLGNGLVLQRDGTWKLVRSMLDYGA